MRISEGLDKTSHQLDIEEHALCAKSFVFWR
jgi:hypothetical protein